jgi:putative ABC transport system permease protein
LLEGITLTALGSSIGLLLGHATIITMGSLLPEVQKAGVTGMVFYVEEGMIWAGSLLLGLVCSLIPAIQAYRTDISKVLAGN